MSTGQSREDFESRLGELFEIGAGATALALRLASVRPLGEGLREGGAFALGFEGPAEPILAQATYRLTHRGMGAIDMFIVPVGRTESGLPIYEAVYT